MDELAIVSAYLIIIIAAASMEKVRLGCRLSTAYKFSPFDF